ncbi:hypothetical protein ACFL26_01055 [Patescibacteria group bacterium]
MSPGRKRTNAVALRQERQKKALVEQLGRVPVVQVACEKLGVGRATYYRWRADDPKFAAAADRAIADGRGLINDLAESQLLSAIRDRNMSAIVFWLKCHHADYATKLKVSGEVRHVPAELTPEQEEVVREALRLSMPADDNSNDREPHDGRETD